MMPLALGLYWLEIAVLSRLLIEDPARGPAGARAGARRTGRRARVRPTAKGLQTIDSLIS